MARGPFPAGASARSLLHALSGRSARRNPTRSTAVDGLRGEGPSRRKGFRLARRNPFLRSRLPRNSVADLGRVFKVVQETWLAADNPRHVKPERTELVSRRTASDAADLARAAAQAYAERGFDKRTGAWWGSDGERFHRFVVASSRVRRRGLPVLSLGVAALAVGLTAALMRPRPDHDDP